MSEDNNDTNLGFADLETYNKENENMNKNDIHFLYYENCENKNTKCL
jgi:hypothetical protein